MRDVSKEELEQYFRFVHRDKTPDNFSKEQALLIRDCLHLHVLPMLREQAVKMKDDGLRFEDFLTSVWVFAFQMGREFESRLFTAAIKNGKLDITPIPGIH